jgi:hypothetical protein
MAAEEDAGLEEILSVLAGEHRPEVVYFDEWHVETPAEVCVACSDPVAGRWVPVSFCPAAMAAPVSY